MTSGQKSYTAGGNRHTPNKAQFLKWVKECWSSRSNELCQKSLRSCGISMNGISFEVAEIHCLKTGAVVTLHVAAPAITDVTRKLLQEDKRDEEDSLHNSYAEVLIC